jgi:predicted amidohydrolase YtcJ
MIRVYTNGQVLTMNPLQPRVSVFGILHDRFFGVGSEKLLKNIPTEMVEHIDLGGRTVIPGFIESHNHLSMYATTLVQVDCRAEMNRDINELKKKIRVKADQTAPGQWVLGFGYDDTLISDRRHLNRSDLDEAVPHHPVLIMHVSAHLAYANSQALAIAGVGPETPQPEGGHIDLDKVGRPSGLLLEPAAIDLVKKHVPKLNTNQYRELLQKAIPYYHRHGITSTHDGAVGYTNDAAEIIQAYRQLEAAGALDLRVYLSVMYSCYDLLASMGLGSGFGSDYLKIGSVKMFQDGSIQALTAALSEDYLNRPGHRGACIHSQEILNNLVEKYHRSGLQIAIHANGDRAIDSVLQALERAQDLAPRDNCRHMLIHAQMASLDHIRQMKALQVIPSYFVNHVYYWGDRHLNLFLGPRRAAAIDPLGTSLREGLPFTLHSDLPVTPVDPLASIHNAVNRVTREGQVLGPEERIPVLEAFRAYTTQAAVCSFEENLKGSIVDGRLADFTMLSDNPLSILPEKIKDLEILGTFVGGKKVYEPN